MEPCPRSSSAWRVREARGPDPQEAAFPSGQATPLASRRAALAKAGPFAYKTSHHGAWRSMVAHLLWEQGVAGSNPVAPTIKRSRGHTTMWCDLFLCKMAAPSRAVFFAMARHGTYEGSGRIFFGVCGASGFFYAWAGSVHRDTAGTWPGQAACTSGRWSAVL